MRWLKYWESVDEKYREISQDEFNDKFNTLEKIPFNSEELEYLTNYCSEEMHNYNYIRYYRWDKSEEEGRWVTIKSSILKNASALTMRKKVVGRYLGFDFGFDIVKLEDDWFLIFLDDGNRYFICDEFEGLTQFMNMTQMQYI